MSDIRRDKQENVMVYIYDLMSTVIFTFIPIDLIVKVVLVCFQVC